MYLHILKKDLKRKKTMNAIVLIFIILAATFIASSANNMLTVATALDEYFEMAEVPDYWYATPYEKEAERFEQFAANNGYGLRAVKLIQIDPRDVLISGERFEYSNSIVLSGVKGSRVFDKNGELITQVEDGEIYVPAEIFFNGKNDFYEGCSIEIEFCGEKKSFTLKGSTRDALFGSSMIGMTRFLVSDRDLAFFDREGELNSDGTEFSLTKCISLAVYTDDDSYMEKFNDFSLKSIVNIDRAGIKMMYIMDMLIAAVVLVVSICLILISMVILRFTIHFTLSEEFREIGVMKAIGIPNGKIRMLYIAKYFAISVLGAGIGLGLSFPFGNLLIQSVSKNIILSGKNKFYLNILCAAGTAGIVVLFCYFCTRKICRFSPVDAVRSGETGERFKKKSMISLSRSRLKPVPFMAVNDILSGIKKYLSMILIFTLGLLLIIIPVNTINTLQSDKIFTLFSMADCDITILQELMFSANGKNETMVQEGLEGVRQTLREHGIEAEVFQEIMFRFNVSYSGKKSSSLAFLGIGGVRADQYAYLEGSAPRNPGEVALSYITADKIGAGIGDTVEIELGTETKKFIVTAMNQSMNNLGEGIRFYEGEELDFNLAIGSFAIQISYKDQPDKETAAARREMLKQAYPQTDVFSAGEYISYMIGDVAGQLEGVKSLILGIILCINILVALLMVKSFLTREKGEIAMLKAIGFQNSSLVAWQSMRIGIVLLLSIVIGTVISTPLTKLAVEPLFRMMGAYSVAFEVVAREVYFIYPLAMLAATVLAAAAGATQVRKIAASETSNIE